MTNDIGKRLYSFLRTIKNPLFEKIFSTRFLYENAISFMRQYKYIDCENLCKLLSLKPFHIEGEELHILLDTEYDNLVGFLKINSEDSKYLHQLFKNAGISCIRLISINITRRETYMIDVPQITLLDDKFYLEYLKNDYLKLNVISNYNMQILPFESFFYMSIINDYTTQIYEGYGKFEYNKLSTDNKIRCLFNKSILESWKTYKHNGQTVTKYINSLPDVREREIYSLYLDVLEGNNKRLRELETSLTKLKEQYYNSNTTFVGCSSLLELYKIRKITIELYSFYFLNSLFFKRFKDFKKILKYHIEAVICVNGNFKDKTTNGLFNLESVKERYAIDKIDFDIMTKYISVKDLFELIKKYSLSTFNVSEELVNHAIVCYENLADFVILGWRFLRLA